MAIYELDGREWDVDTDDPKEAARIIGIAQLKESQSPEKWDEAMQPEVGESIKAGMKAFGEAFSAGDSTLDYIKRHWRDGGEEGPARTEKDIAVGESLADQMTTANVKAGVNAAAGILPQAAAGIAGIGRSAWEAATDENIDFSVDTLAHNIKQAQENFHFAPYKDPETNEVMSKSEPAWQQLEENITDSLVQALGVTDIENQVKLQGIVRYTMEFGLPGTMLYKGLRNMARTQPSKAVLERAAKAVDNFHETLANKKKIAEEEAAGWDQTLREEAMREQADLEGGGGQSVVGRQFGGDTPVDPALQALNDYQVPNQGLGFADMPVGATRAALRDAGAEARGRALELEPMEPRTAPDASGVPFEDQAAPMSRIDRQAYGLADEVEKTADIRENPPIRDEYGRTADGRNKWLPNEEGKAVSREDISKELTIENETWPRSGPLGGTGKRGRRQGGATDFGGFVKTWRDAARKRDFKQFKEAVEAKFGKGVYGDDVVKVAYAELKKGAEMPEQYQQAHRDQWIRDMLPDDGEISGYGGDLIPLETVHKVVDEMNPQDISDSALKKGGRALASGMGFVGRWSNNPLIKAASSAAYHFWGNAQKRTRGWIGKESALYTAMRDLEQSSTELKRQFLEAAKEFEGKGYPTDLTQFHPKVAAVIKALSEVSPDMYNALVEGNTAMGISTAPFRKGWLPGLFSGRFTVSVKNADGNVAWYAFHSKKDAHKALPIIERMHKDAGMDVEIGKVEDRRGHRTVRDDDSMYLQVLEDLGNKFENLSPELAQLKKDFFAGRIQRGFQTNVRLHGKGKKGVQGSMGFNRLYDVDKNFKDFSRGFLMYAENLGKYAEYAKGETYMKKLMDSREFRNLENTQEYIRAVWDTNFMQQGEGVRNTINNASRLIHDDLLGGMFDYMGLPRNLSRQFMAKAQKGFFISLFAMFNARFIATQLLQPYQFFSPGMLEARGGKAFAKALGTTIKSIFDGNLPPGLERAYKWAEERGTFDPMFVDQFETFSNDIFNSKTFDTISGQSLIRGVEAHARKQFFTASYLMFKEMGKSDKVAMEQASVFTNEKMVNYSQQFKPLIYNKLGALGMMMSPLTTFKHNYYSQLIQLARQSMRGDPGAAAGFVALLSMQLALAGAYGMPLVQEWEALMELAKEAGLVDPSKNLTLSDIVMDPRMYAQRTKSQEVALTGLFNGFLNINLAPSFAAASVAPSTLFPVFGWLGDALHPAVKDGSSGWEAFLDKVMPKGPLGGLWQEQHTNEQGMYFDPRKSEKTAKYQREGAERVLPYFGLNSTKEAYTLGSEYKEKRAAAREGKNRKEMRDEIWNAWIEGDAERAQALANEFAQTPEGAASLKSLITKMKQYSRGERTHSEKIQAAGGRSGAISKQRAGYLSGERR